MRCVFFNGIGPRARSERPLFCHPYLLDKTKVDLSIRTFKNLCGSLIKFYFVRQKILCISVETRRPIFASNVCIRDKMRSKHSVSDINSICTTFRPQSKCFGQTKLDFTRKLIDFTALEMGTENGSRRLTVDNEKQFINFKFINKTQVVIVWFVHSVLPHTMCTLCIRHSHPSTWWITRNHRLNGVYQQSDNQKWITCSVFGLNAMWERKNAVTRTPHRTFQIHNSHTSMVQWQANESVCQCVHLSCGFVCALVRYVEVVLLRNACGKYSYCLCVDNAS